jgi:hypothetical protein
MKPHKSADDVTAEVCQKYSFAGFHVCKHLHQSKTQIGPSDRRSRWAKVDRGQTEGQIETQWSDTASHADRVARLFLVQHTKMEKNYHMTTKYTKWLYT